MNHKYRAGPGIGPRDGKRMGGFTLMEVMLSVGIAAILMGVAVPNLRQFILNSRITGAANDLTVAFTTARAQAVKTRVQTIVCFTTNSDASPPVCDGNGTQGWVVFSDANADGTPTAGEPVLLRHAAIPNTLGVRTKPDTNAAFVAYAPSGFSKKLTAIGADLTSVVLCDSRGNSPLYGATNSTARGIQISATGRSHVTRVVADISGIGGCP
jgi:type IV fimbrial biogenesis protein FimT